MNGAITVAERILRTMRGDARTLGLVFILPAFIVFLLSEVFPPPRPPTVAPAILGVVVFFLTYMLTAIGFLRERTAGTLERVLVAPISRTGIVLGYVLGYGCLAAIQSLLLLAAGVMFLDVSFELGAGIVLIVELSAALTALGIGIVLSLFADTEFQAIQFIPLVITPQVLLGGTFLPVEDLPAYLEWPARAMPLTYVIDAMDYAVAGRGTETEFHVATAVLSGFAVLSILLASAVVRRVE